MPIRYKIALFCAGSSLAILHGEAAFSQTSTSAKDASSPHFFVTRDFSDRGLVATGVPVIEEVEVIQNAEVLDDAQYVAMTLEAVPAPSPALPIETSFQAVSTQSAALRLDVTDWVNFQSEDFSGATGATPDYAFGIRPRFELPDTPVINAINLALRERDRAYSSRPDYIDFSARYDFSALRENTGLNVDLGFSPSAGLYQDGDVRVRRIGAEFRVGQNFDQRGKRVKSDSWYFFAGAAGEALVWDAGTFGFNPSNFLTLNGITLRDRVTVGDIQAGISVERFGGQISLSYVHRQIIYGDQALETEIGENFGGISFTLSR